VKEVKDKNLIRVGHDEETIPPREKGRLRLGVRRANTGGLHSFGAWPKTSRSYWCCDVCECLSGLVTGNAL
jgi:hypothetical protein